MSRQNFYKKRKKRGRHKVNEALVREYVEQERVIQPRLGGLKLYHLLRPKLLASGVVLGRDRFFEVLRAQDLLLKPLPRAARTTDSRHRLPVFTNLIKKRSLTGPNQVWVSDITYIRLVGGFVYLSLITDKYSRKLVGYHLSPRMEAKDTLKALDMALRDLPASATPIHHSDRGSQYCSHDYVKRLKKHGLSVSMTEENHCAENALAERVNGILKQEYFLRHTFRDFAQARRAVQEAIALYNKQRPHRALKMATPEIVHQAAA